MHDARKYSWLAATTAVTAALGWAAIVQDVRAPEPADLVGSMIGSVSAAATWVASDRATTGFRLPATPGPCPTGATNASPCHSAPVDAGTRLYGRVVKAGSPPLCRCAS